MKVQHAYTSSLTIEICPKHYAASAVDYLGPVLDSRGRRCGHACAANHKHPWGEPAECGHEFFVLLGGRAVDVACALPSDHDGACSARL